MGNRYLQQQYVPTVVPHLYHGGFYNGGVVVPQVGYLPLQELPSVSVNGKVALPENVPYLQNLCGESFCQPFRLQELCAESFCQPFYL